MNIPVYIVNLPGRLDRKSSITKEVTSRKEFDFKIEEPIEHGNGAFSLWITIQKIVQRAKESKCAYYILSDDDDQFTFLCDFLLLNKCIGETQD